MKGQAKYSIFNLNSPYPVFLSFLFLTAILVFSPTISHSARVMLAWDPNTEEDLAGYKIYYGVEKGNYAYSIDVGNQTTYTITDLEPNRVHYFAATAYSVYGDESGFSAEISHFVPAGELPPVADAGPDQIVDEGATVILDESNSTDPNNDIDSYLWEQVDGPTVELSNPVDGKMSFIAPDVGPDGASLTFRLTVTDTHGLQSQDSCVVNVSWTNLPPTAKAGSDQTVEGGSRVTLSAIESSDLDDGIASYLWEQTGGAVVIISDSTAVQPDFVAPDAFTEDVSLTFQLTAEDLGGLRSTDTCVVNVSWTNTPPTADAGPDQFASEGNTVTLDGSNSSDPDDGIAFVRWEQLNGIPMVFSDPSAPQPTFVVPDVIIEGESLTFQLTVTDKGGLRSQDTCTVKLAGNIVCDDAEDGKTAGWSVYDNKPKKAKISNVFDQNRQSRVIQLSGRGWKNGYVLRNEDGSDWRNTTQFVVQWSMSFSENFEVYLDVETTSGHFYLNYTPADYDNLGKESGYVHHGLGSNIKDAQWYTFTRDLQADLEDAQPNVTILEVNGFLIRGSGKVDDIKLLSYQPLVIE
ncbi:MAG: fibronectin type III domain-containing protein [Deltaproteobacteria bacterium]|nr:fibronectin type III domain-containing protein [Deltaproteobacteria bacterium]